MRRLGPNLRPGVEAVIASPRLGLGYGAMAIGLSLASTNLVLLGAVLFSAVLLSHETVRLDLLGQAP